MRADTKVYFVRQGKPTRLDNSVANFEVGTATKTAMYANVSRMDEERVVMIFGDAKVKAFTVRILKPLKETFQWVEIDGKRYSIERVSTVKNKQVYIVRG